MHQNLKLNLQPHARRPFEHIAAHLPELVALRRDLHAHPELGFEEVYTARRVTEALKVCGVDAIHTGIGKTGVVAVIEGRKPVPAGAKATVIGLRADMDALPLTERSGLPWVSTHKGRMHACGHDGHTAMLVGAARYLASTRNFAGTAVLIFQPGEEGFAGARAMIEDGLFERFPVHEVYAMHNWPSMPAGTVGVNDGAMMAAADRVQIDISGRGGHGAHPYLTIDPVLVAGHIITAVQSIVARNVRPLDNAVISLCAMQAGDLGAMSVVPDRATLVGTVRTFSTTVQSLVERRLQELCQSVAQAFGATATVRFEHIYPATINTARQARYAGDVASALVGEGQLNRDIEPSMGAEDFSFMLQAKPGAYLRLGQGTGQGANQTPADCFLHNPGYDFNDEVLPLGAALFAGLVEQGGSAV
jgi:amidohydrolase